MNRTLYLCALACLIPLAASAQDVRSATSAEVSAGNHVLIGENAMIDRTFLSKHTEQSNGGYYGDGSIVADFWFDSVHRRVMARSLQLFEINDPADIRIGRAPGHWPNTLGWYDHQRPGEIVGHVGFVPWSATNGFGAYFAAVQGGQYSDTTGALYLATSPAVRGRSRAGWLYEPGELVQHVAVLPNGQTIFGFNTDPAQIPEELVIIEGNLRVKGTVYADKCVEVSQ